MIYVRTFGPRADRTGWENRPYYVGQKLPPETLEIQADCDELEALLPHFPEAKTRGRVVVFVGSEADKALKIFNSLAK